MTHKEHLDQIDAALKQMVADKSQATAEDIAFANDISSGLEIWARDQLEQLAASKGVELWVDREEARKLDASRSRH